MGKGENAGYQHFLIFPQYFQKASLIGSLKVVTVWYRVKTDDKISRLNGYVTGHSDKRNNIV